MVVFCVKYGRTSVFCTHLLKCNVHKHARTHHTYSHAVFPSYAHHWHVICKLTSWFVLCFWNNKWVRCLAKASSKGDKRLTDTYCSNHTVVYKKEKWSCFYVQQWNEGQRERERRLRRKGTIRLLLWFLKINIASILWTFVKILSIYKRCLLRKILLICHVSYAHLQDVQWYPVPECLFVTRKQVLTYHRSHQAALLSLATKTVLIFTYFPNALCIDFQNLTKLSHLAPWPHPKLSVPQRFLLFRLMYSEGSAQYLEYIKTC